MGGPAAVARGAKDREILRVGLTVGQDDGWYFLPDTVSQMTVEYHVHLAAALAVGNRVATREHEAFRAAAGPAALLLLDDDLYDGGQDALDDIVAIGLPPWQCAACRGQRAEDGDPDGRTAESPPGAPCQ